jgi:prepilin-type N-terminal cleavage/methylation domain-containing protein
VSRRTGFTLVETAIALVIVGLLVLIAFPKMRTAMAANDVRASRTMVVNMLAKTRTAATIANRRTWLMVGGNRAWILARPRRVPPLAGNNADTLGLVENIGTRYGTTVVLPNSPLDSIGFDPRGFASGWAGSSTTITVSKSGHTNIITVDGKGRVAK